jgi:serine/threonine protein kinase
MDNMELFQQYLGALSKLSRFLEPGWRVYYKPTYGLTFQIFILTTNILPKQGWKIHISAAAVEAVSLCEVVLPLLIKRRVNFKIPTTVSGIMKINSGSLGKTQIGKIVTIYPKNNQEVSALAKELDELWHTSAGPAIPSDLRLRSHGAVFLRYGAFGTGKIISDSAGRIDFALQLPDGSLTKDQRSEDSKMPDWTPEPPIPCTGSKGSNSNQEVVVVEHRKYLPLALLYTAPKGKVMLGLSLDTCETVIIKTARSGVLGDHFGFDAQDRLRNEYSVLAALTSEAGLAPYPIGLSKDDGITLIMKDVQGTALNKLSQEDQLANLPALARAIAQLHNLGFVHRDIKLSNALLAKGTVWLIDFELAAPLGTEKPIPGGTPGYMPPEDVDGCVTSASDIYALGVCLAHAILGQDLVAAFPYGSGRLVGLLHLVGAHLGAEIVKHFTLPIPERRPSAIEAADILQQKANKLTSTFETPIKQIIKLGTRSWCQRAAWEAAITTKRYINPKHYGHSWQNFHFQADFESEGINLGAAGIILGLISIEQAFGLNSFKDDICAGAKWLTSRSLDDSSIGFFTGNAGVAIALTIASIRLKYPQFLEHASSRLAAATLPSPNLDLFSGSAGVVWAGCLMADILGEDWPLHIVRDRAEAIIAAAEIESGVIVWAPPKELGASNSPYIGAAHGSAGIAAVLAMWGKRVGCQPAVKLALETFSSIYIKARSADGSSLQRALGSKNSSPAANGTWCHGTAGYLWSILQSFGDHPALREQIDWATHIFASVNPLGNVTYCHGLSGQLELWRMLQSIPRYQELAKHRSAKVAATLRLLHQRIEGQCIWCSEKPDVITPDLWIGFLAPASALAIYTTNRKDALLSSTWLRTCADSKK